MIPEIPDEVAVGTPEWDLLVQRRAQLILKKNGEGLTPEEWAEDRRLNAISLAAIAVRFPCPTDTKLENLYAKLDKKLLD